MPTRDLCDCLWACFSLSGSQRVGHASANAKLYPARLTTTLPDGTQTFDAGSCLFTDIELGSTEGILALSVLATGIVALASPSDTADCKQVHSSTTVLPGVAEHSRDVCAVHKADLSRCRALRLLLYPLWRTVGSSRLPHDLCTTAA
jgi:hypothetical protein